MVSTRENGGASIPASPETNISVDVLVVGLGIAGVCSALEASRAGANVLVVERASAGGGASSQSEGIFYLGGGTSLQTDLGISDTPDNMFAFLRASTTAPEEHLREFCNGAVEHFEWLEREGVPFQRQQAVSKAVASRSGDGLLATGNESVWPFSNAATPAPRGHQARALGRHRGGLSAMSALLAQLEAEAVPIKFETSVTELMAEGSQVIGARLLNHDGTSVEVRARLGVVLATGSFNFNRELTHKHFPVIAGKAQPLGIDNNNGAGLQLACDVGADLEAMSGVIATGSIYPPESLIFGIILNADGERFIGEDSYHGRVAHHLAQQPEQKAWSLVDEEHFAYPACKHPLIDIFESVERLERELGLPIGSVSSTINRYNAEAREGLDSQFHKNSKWVAPIDFPVAVFDISMNVDRYHFIALGGLRTDINGRVLDHSDHPIAGLYAAGAVTAHLTRDGSEYASRLSLGPGSFFARRAGKHVTRHIRDLDTEVEP